MDDELDCRAWGAGLVRSIASIAEADRQSLQSFQECSNMLKVMNFSLGEQLGAMIALAEKDLDEDVDDLRAIQRLALVSETYKNLVLAKVDGIEDSFLKGYNRASEQLGRERQSFSGPSDTPSIEP